MKIIVAPDSYKDNLRSIEVARHIGIGLKTTLPGACVVLIPMADGGEGTVEAVLASFPSGRLEKVMAHDPLMRPVEAVYGDLSSDRAVMEMASASGIELLKSHELNPLKTTTYGTGELLDFLIKSGKKEILIGIGGSATTDGGAGFLQGLGVRFFDSSKNELPVGLSGGDLDKIAAADMSCLANLPRDLKIKVMCDVDNPLTGVRGAARVFSPQKGATPLMVDALERNLLHYREVMKCRVESPGDGAAGGLGFALRQIGNAQFHSGADLLMSIIGFPEMVADADWVITGEGKTDSQTAGGKLCARIAAICREKHKPVILLSGALQGDYREFLHTYTAVFSISTGALSLAEALARSRENLEAAGASVGALLRSGQKNSV